MFRKELWGRGDNPGLRYKASITLTPNPDKDTTRKESYRPLFLMNRDAKCSTRVANQIQQHIKESYTTTKWDLDITEKIEENANKWKDMPCS